MAWVVAKYVPGESPQGFYLFKDGFKSIRAAYWAIVREEVDLYKSNCGIEVDDPILDGIEEDIIVGEIIDGSCQVLIDGGNYEYYILRNQELTSYAFMCKIKNKMAHKGKKDEEV